MTRAMSYDPANPPMMRCGHAANAEGKVTIDGEETWVPSCAICMCREQADAPRPDLTGRVSLCMYANPTTGTCKKRRNYVAAYPSKTDSNWALPFFQHRPDADTDRHYCGCWGWD